jgi:hypothetical protein
VLLDLALKAVEVALLLWLLLGLARRTAGDWIVARFALASVTARIAIRTAWTVAVMLLAALEVGKGDDR